MCSVEWAGETSWVHTLMLGAHTDVEEVANNIFICVILRALSVVNSI